MSRREDMTEDGKLPCSLCKEWKFIGEFFTQKVHEDTSFKYVWFGDPVTGKQYGRPNSYCKKCNLISQRGTEAVCEYKAKITSWLRTRVDDYDEAWRQALSEATDRSTDDPLIRMMRAVGMRP